VGGGARSGDAQLLRAPRRRRAFAALDDARGAANALNIKGGRAGLAGGWHTMLHASVDSIEQCSRLGGQEAGLVATFMSAAVALGNLGRFETSARIAGYVTKAAAEFGNETFIQMVEANEARLREALGEARVAELDAEGATLSRVDAMACLRAAEQELDERPTRESPGK
jgi:hypothetical protein